MSFRAFLACMYNTPIDKNDFVQQRDCNCSRVADDSSSSSRRCSKSNVSLVRRKRVLMSDDLRTDHVKLESPSILTKNSFFAWPLGEGWVS